MMQDYVFKKWWKRAVMSVFDALGYIFFIFFRLKKIPEDPGNILVLRLDQTGDVIQSIPFFRAIRKKYPDSHITAVVVKGNEFLFSGNTDIDSVRTVGKLWFHKNGSGNLMKASREIKQIKGAGSSIAFDLRGDLRNILMLFLAGFENICGYGCAGGGFLLRCRKKYVRDEHEIDKNLKLIGECPSEKADIGFYVPEDSLEEAEKYLRSGYKIVVHPFAGSGARMWGLEKYRKLIEKILDEKENAVVYITGGPDDKKYRDAFDFGDKIVDIIGLDFLPTIGIIKKSSMFIGNDSSLQYFAAYSGVKTFVVYGYTLNIERWKPKVSDETFEYASIPVDCGPCELAECNQDTHRCMDLITVDMVYEKIVKWL